MDFPMPDSLTPLRIALVDDQELFIESLQALFNTAETPLEVIWSARCGEEALEKAREQLPDVVLMDYFFKGKVLDGGETTRLLTEEHPEIKVLMLSVSCDLSVIRESLQKGATGYVSKEVSKQELLRAIQEVARGAYFLDQTAMQEVIGLLVKKMPKSLLTRREIEVAKLYMVGKQIKEIAGDLYISEDTVESHIKNIRAKTGASSRYEVAEYLKKLGLADE